MKRTRTHENFRTSLDKTHAQIERGGYIEIRNEADSQALLERIMRNGRARLAAKQKKSRPT